MRDPTLRHIFLGCNPDITDHVYLDELMKTVALCITCFLLAFVLGRWAPSYDLTVAKLQIKDLERKLEQGDSGSNTQVTRMLGIRPVKENVRPPKKPSAENTSTHAPAGTNQVAQAEQSDEERPRRRGRHRRGLANENMDEAIELWELRTELAKTAFMDKLDASKEEALNFNVLMESLNLRAEASISNWVAKVEHQETISSEDGLRLFNSILGSVVLTYDEMDRKLPENWREGVDDDFQLMEMIDPRVAKPLMKLEDRMGQVRFF